MLSPIARKKSYLFIGNQASIAKRLSDALDPLLTKPLVITTSEKEALAKIKNQEFDVVFLAHGATVLGADRTLFLTTQAHGHRKISAAWLVFSQGVESSDLVTGYPGTIKFMAQDWKVPALFELLTDLLADKAPVPRSVLDVNFINPFLSAVTDVTLSLAKVELRSGPLNLRKPGSAQPALGDLCGIVPIRSEIYSGTLGLAFQKSLALKLYNNMAKTSKESLDEDVKDNTIKVTNFVFENAQRELKKLGYSILPATSCLVTGADHELTKPREGVVIHLPFSSDFGNLDVQCVVAAKGAA